MTVSLIMYSRVYYIHVIDSAIHVKLRNSQCAINRATTCEKITNPNMKDNSKTILVQLPILWKAQ